MSQCYNSCSKLIQKAPDLLVAIKEVVDQHRSNGDFLLTGSANLLGFKTISDSLAGRIGILELWLLKAVKQCEQNTQLFHYRTSDQREIDFLLQRGDKRVPIEVKAAKTVRKGDFAHIEHLQQRDECVGNGVVLYQGEEIIPFGRNRALPISVLCK